MLKVAREEFRYRTGKLQFLLFFYIIFLTTMEIILLPDCSILSAKEIAFYVDYRSKYVETKHTRFLQEFIVYRWRLIVAGDVSWSTSEKFIGR